MFAQFPAIPQYKGEWRAIQLEPIVGSGERITIAITATGQNGEHKAIQAIRPELLESLYGEQAKNMGEMITLVLQSIHSQRMNLNDWVSPFEGVRITPPQFTISKDLNGILRQAIQLSASLSSLALASEQNEDTQSGLVKRENQNWLKTVKEIVISRKPDLADYFDTQYQASLKSPVKSKLSFVGPNYVANIGTLQATRLSPSVQAIKSKILDIEMFSPINTTLFENHGEITRELIVGIPNIEQDITLSKRSAQAIKDYTNLLSEISDKQNISFYTVHTFNSAANRIIQMC